MFKDNVGHSFYTVMSACVAAIYNSTMTTVANDSFYMWKGGVAQVAAII